MTLEFKESVISVLVNNKNQEIKLDEPVIQRMKENIRFLLNSLQENNFDWKANSNLLVFNVVYSSIDILKLVKKYKSLSLEDKKNICFNIVEKYIEDEIKNLNISKEMKELAQHGVDTIIEPIVEVTIMSLLQKTKCFEKLIPCLRG